MDTFPDVLYFGWPEDYEEGGPESSAVKAVADLKKAGVKILNEKDASDGIHGKRVAFDVEGAPLAYYEALFDCNWMMISLAFNMALKSGDKETMIMVKGKLERTRAAKKEEPCQG